MIIWKNGWSAELTTEVKLILVTLEVTIGVKSSLYMHNIKGLAAIGGGDPSWERQL